MRWIIGMMADLTATLAACITNPGAAILGASRMLPTCCDRRTVKGVKALDTNTIVTNRQSLKSFTGNS